MNAPATTDIDALKSRLKATWMDGNYDYFSRFMESSAVEFLDRLGVHHWTSHNQASEPDRTIVDAEYLEVVGVRK